MKGNQNMIGLMTRGYLHEKEVAALTELLTGEISAVEAYNLALEKIKEKQLIAALEECRNSHALRVATLQERMEELQEEPPESSGWWGAVARFAERSATAFSDRVALSVLAAGEDYGLTQYELVMKDLDVESFAIVEGEIFPAQKKTLQTMYLLCALLRSQAHKNDAEDDKDHESGSNTAA